MKLKNFAFLPPLDEVKKAFIERMKSDYPEIEILAFDDESEVLENIHIISTEVHGDDLIVKYLF